MKTTRMLLALAGVAMMAALPLQAVEPREPKAAKVSEKKWLEGGKGYQEALALQKETGADILLYVAQYTPPDRKGLSTWFERRGLQHGRVVDGVKPYIKVKVTWPLDKKEEAALAGLKINGGPTLWVVQPNGRSGWVAPFDWPGNEPKVKQPEDLLKELSAKSSPVAAPTAP